MYHYKSIRRTYKALALHVSITERISQLNNDLGVANLARVQLRHNTLPIVRL